MSTMILTVKKSCNICKFCDVDESGDFLVCLKYDNKVEDKFVCQEFGISRDILDDTILDVLSVEEK